MTADDEGGAGDVVHPKGGALISVILTSYRSDAAQLRAAVDSVLGQSWKNLELLIVDDNRGDHPGLDSKSPFLTDMRVRVVSNQGRGRVAALNLGVESARGEIVAIIDDDDLWERDKLTWDMVHLNRQSAQLVCCRSIPFSDELVWPRFDGPPKAAPLTLDALLVKNFVHHSTVTAYKDIVWYDPAAPIAHDYELLLRVLTEGRPAIILNQARGGQRVGDSHFNRPKSVWKELSHYTRSAAIQWRYAWRNRKYGHLIFPVGKIVYTPFRRHVIRLRLLAAKVAGVRRRTADQSAN